MTVQLLTLIDFLSFFVTSIFIYQLGYYLLFKIVNKEFPKTYKDLRIQALNAKVEMLEKQNHKLSEENTKISESIIRRLQS